MTAADRSTPPDESDQEDRTERKEWERVIALHDSECPDRRCSPTVIGDYLRRVRDDGSTPPDDGETKGGDTR